MFFCKKNYDYENEYEDREFELNDASLSDIGMEVMNEKWVGKRAQSNVSIGKNKRNNFYHNLRISLLSLLVCIVILFLVYFIALLVFFFCNEKSEYVRVFY